MTDDWTAGDPAIAWRIDGPIAPGASVTLTYSASLVAASTLHDGQTIANTAAVPHYFGASTATRTANPTTVYRDYTDGGSDAVNVVLDFPTFSAVKTTGATGSPDSANAEVGQDFAWRVVVTNTSTTATASDVQVTDTLPATWAYRSGTTAGASEPTVADGTLVWTVPSLAPGASATITYTARALPGAAATGVNTARVTAAHDEAGNAGTGDGAYGSTSDTASATLQTPALTLAKTPDHGAATAGSASSFTLTVTNGGTATARNLDVTDVLPAGLAYAAGAATASPAAGFSETSRAAGPGAGETTVHWRVTTLAAGASVTITVPVTVAADVPSATTLVNTASVGADELVGTTSDTGSLDVTTSADVAIVKTGAATYTPGTNYTWHLRVRNLGPSDARAVSVSDPLPAGTTFVSADAPCTQAGGTVTCALGTLAPGADHTYDVTVDQRRRPDRGAEQHRHGRDHHPGRQRRQRQLDRVGDRRGAGRRLGDQEREPERGAARPRHDVHADRPQRRPVGRARGDPERRAARRSCPSSRWTARAARAVPPCPARSGTSRRAPTSWSTSPRARRSTAPGRTPRRSPRPPRSRAAARRTARPRTSPSARWPSSRSPRPVRPPWPRAAS